MSMSTFFSNEAEQALMGDKEHAQKLFSPTTSHKSIQQGAHYASEPIMQPHIWQFHGSALPAAPSISYNSAYPSPIYYAYQNDNPLCINFSEQTRAPQNPCSIHLSHSPALSQHPPLAPLQTSGHPASCSRHASLTPPGDITPDLTTYGIPVTPPQAPRRSQTAPQQTSRSCTTSSKQSSAARSSKLTTYRCAYPGCTSTALFTRGCDLRKHFKRHSRTLFCRHKDCPQASEGGFSTSKDRARHEAKHDPKVPCAYDGCGRVFSRVDNMKDHLRRIHQKEGAEGKVRKGKASS